MDAPPPPPNNNNNNNRDNNNARRRAKQDPYDGRNRRRNGRGGVNENGEMDVFGSMEDSGPIVMLFFMGLVSFMLRERCTC